jgi:hypothetical protein
MSLDVLRSLTRDLVSQLVHGEYQSVVRQCAKSRLTSDDLRAVISGYGRKLALPPANAYDDLDVVQVKDAVIPTWSVRAPLWTEEEGRSDLTLELTIAAGSDPPSIELDDLEVL